MLFNNTQAASEHLGCKFFCSCGKHVCKSRPLYRGITIDFRRSIWMSLCASCGTTYLVSQQFDHASCHPIVRELLINYIDLGPQEQDIHALWGLIKEFIEIGKDYIGYCSGNVLEIQKYNSNESNAFIGFLGSYWLPKIELPSRIKGSILNSIEAKKTEQGIYLSFEDLSLGLFQCLPHRTIVLAAAFIEDFISRQNCINENTINEDAVDWENISMSGVIEYLDRMSFHKGNPLLEVSVITKLLSMDLLVKKENDWGEGSAKAEKILKKAATILWFFKDAICENEEYQKEKLERKNKSEMVNGIS